MLLFGAILFLLCKLCSLTIPFTANSDISKNTITKLPFAKPSTLPRSRGIFPDINTRRFGFVSHNTHGFLSTIAGIDSSIDRNSRLTSRLEAYPLSSAKSRPPDLASLLLSERIVYIGYPIQQTVAHLVISQLLYLDYDSQEKPIKMYVCVIRRYINSDNDQSGESGISTSEIDALNIVDVINYLKNEVITINLGKAYGPAAVILASGTPGKRYVLPRSYTLLRQSPTTIPFRQAEDIAIYSDEILKARKSIIRVLSNACNKNEAEILDKINIGDYMGSQETVAFGLADKVLEDVK